MCIIMYNYNDIIIYIWNLESWYWWTYLQGSNGDADIENRFMDKSHLVKAMFFPVVMYGCESWSIKKAKHWIIDAFKLWCWRRLLRVPWTVRRIQPVRPKGNQSWICIGRTDAEAEAPILWPPDRKGWLIGEQHPNAGKVGSKKGQQRMKWLDR